MSLLSHSKFEENKRKRIKLREDIDIVRGWRRLKKEKQNERYVRQKD